MNRVNELKRALDSVFTQTYKNFEIVIVDNNSSDNTIKMLETDYPNIKLIKSDKNIGCPMARNLSVKYSKGEIIFFLDDDAWIESNVLVELNKQFNLLGNDVKIIYTNMIQYNAQKTFMEFKKGDYPVPMPYFPGGIAAIKKDVFEKISYYPDFHYGGEEAHIAIELFRRNLKIYLLPYIYSHHKPSFVRDNNLIFYNKTKNILIWDITFSPFLILPIIFLWNSFSYSYNAHKDHHLKASLKGVLEAIHIFSKIIKDRKPLSTKLFIDYIKYRKKSVRNYRLRETIKN